MARACSAGGGILVLGSAAEAEVEKSCEGRQPHVWPALGTKLEEKSGSKETRACTTSGGSLALEFD